MIRAKQLGAFSQCARNVILSGSRRKSADGAPSCLDDESSNPDDNSGNSVLVTGSTLRTGSPELKKKLEAFVPLNPSFREQNRYNHSVLLSKVSSDELAKCSASAVGLFKITGNYDDILQTQSVIGDNISPSSGGESSGKKSHRTAGTRRVQSAPSSGTSSFCSSLGPESDGRQARKTERNGQNRTYPAKMNGGSRHAIELYHHTLQQIKWGTAAEEMLNRISYKLDPFQANQVLKRLDDFNVALGFFNWLKRQPCFKHDNYTYTTMVGILGRARQFDAVKVLLEEMKCNGCEPNVVTYNRLIHGYGQANYINQALGVFYRMQEAGCVPDRVTYSTLIDIHAKAGYLDEAVDLYKKMKKAGLSPDTFTYSVMINCLGKAGHLPIADKLFDEMIRQGCAPNLVTYNIMIALHAKARNNSRALRVYQTMRSAGFRPDKITYCIVMEVLGNFGQAEEAEALFMEMKHVFVPDTPVYGLLVDMWGKVGNPDKARAWYDSMLDFGLRPNVPTCNSLLCAFLRRQRFSEANEILKNMMDLGLEPSLQTFTLLLSCCLETKSHMKHCQEMMAITRHPAHTFLLSLPAAEPGGQNVRSHTSSFLDSIHDEDRESKRGIADSIVDFLHKSGFKEEAGFVWEAVAERNVYPDVVRQKKSSYWVVNLHVMSNGTAIVALSRTMVSFRRLILASGVGPNRLDIITGWGKRSRVTGASLVKQSVGELLRLFRFPFLLEKENSGCFVGCGEALKGWLLNSYVERMHLL